MEKIKEAIKAGKTLQLDYQGQSLHVIPLVLGELKNGKEAMLCYKTNDEGDLSIRLYHMHKVTNLLIGIESAPHSKNIDYYLTKHFRTIYAKV